MVTSAQLSAGDYLNMYELNSAGHVVAFSSVQLTITNTTGLPVSANLNTAIDPTTGGPGLGYHNQQATFLNSELDYESNNANAHAVQVTLKDAQGHPISGSQTVTAGGGFAVAASEGGTFGMTASVMFNANGVGTVYLEESSGNTEFDGKTVSSIGNIMVGTLFSVDGLTVIPNTSITVYYNVPTATITSITTNSATSVVTLTFPALAVGYYEVTITQHSTGYDATIVVPFQVTTAAAAGSTLAINVDSTSAPSVWSPATGDTQGQAFSGAKSGTGFSFIKGNLLEVSYGYSTTSAADSTANDISVGYARAND